MKNPTFSVTALTIAGLTVVAIAKVLLAPSLPASQVDNYITVANPQRLAAPLIEMGWEENFRDGMTLAQSKDYGVLLFLVDPTSVEARNLEMNLFREPELVRLVKRNFIPVRINIGSNSDLASMIYPLSKVNQYALPGASVTTMLPTGEVLSHLQITAAKPQLTYQDMRAFLLSSKHAFEETVKVNPSVSAVEQTQRNDHYALLLPPEVKDFGVDKFVSRLRVSSERPLGGFQQGALIEIRPSVLRLLGKRGEARELEQLVGGVKALGLFDLLDGGFFRKITGEGRLDTSKDFMQIAFAAEVFAQLAFQDKGREYAVWAEECARCLVEKTVIARAAESDQAADGRSWRYSMTNRKLSQYLSDSEQAWLKAHMLGEDIFRQEILRPEKPLDLMDPTWLSIRRKLQNQLPSIAVNRIRVTPEVTGYKAARLFRTGKLLANRDVLDHAQRISERVYLQIENRTYRTGRSLGELLGMVDCGLADFLATRDEKGLDAAFLAFEQAMKEFRMKGVPYPVLNTKSGPLNLQVPELCDNGRESLMAMYLRMVPILAALHPKSAKATQWIEEYREARDQLIPKVCGGGSQVAGMMDAVALAPKVVFASNSVSDEELIGLIRKLPMETVCRLPKRLEPSWARKVIRDAGRYWIWTPNKVLDVATPELVVGTVEKMNQNRA